MSTFETLLLFFYTLFSLLHQSAITVSTNSVGDQLNNHWLWFCLFVLWISWMYGSSSVILPEESNRRLFLIVSQIFPLIYDYVAFGTIKHQLRAQNKPNNKN